MCSVRSLTIQRRPPRKGSSTHLQRRRGQSHDQYPARRPQHPEPDQGRRPSNRGHRQRATNVGGQPTSVSPLTRTGEPRSRGGTYAAAALHDARRSKERTYPELLNNRRCRLVVVGIEVGGRWSNEASNFICMLAKARARSSPPSLQAASHQRGPRLPLVTSPYPCGSYFLCGQPALRRSFSSPQPGRRPSTARPPPFAHDPPRACQSPPSPVEEGLDLHLPYHMHIWRLASIKTVCAWRLPSKTALCQWTFCG